MNSQVKVSLPPEGENVAHVVGNLGYTVAYFQFIFRGHKGDRDEL